MREDGLPLLQKEGDYCFDTIEWVSGVVRRGKAFVLGKHDENGKHEECGVFDGKTFTSANNKGK